MTLTCPFCPGHHVAPAPTGHPVRVSVIVAHYEQHDDLARTLAALADQDLPPDEVIVTDDGSATAPPVPRGVRLLTQPDRGFRVALARNRAAAEATGEVLVFLDADTTPEPGFVAALVAGQEEDPTVLAVGRRRHTTFDRATPSDPLRGARIHELDEPAWLTDGWARTDDLRAADEASFRHVIGSVLACNAAWFRRVGGFDPSFDRYGGEDWELAHRWWSSGGRLRHVRDAVAWHHGPDAGVAPRRWAGGGDEQTAETVAIARRVASAPVGFRGLRSASARVVVTHDEGLGDRELLVSVDGLLAAVPQADVVSARPVWAEVGDPRVAPAHGPSSRTAAVRVHLHEAVRADAGVWPQLTGQADLGDTELRLHLGGRPSVSVTDLRRLRRVHLGLEDPSVADRAAPPGLYPVGDTTLAAWLGGWATPTPGPSGRRHPQGCSAEPPGWGA